jgi:hypothetical protein
MNNYCTNCTYLSKQSRANKTEWRCTHDRYIGYLLQSLCGNPAKLDKCKEEHWFEFKQQEKTMDTKDKIKVMQAYENGKKIQLKNESIDWSDWTRSKEPDWNWGLVDYRIKPTPTYRPYKPEELKALVGKQIEFKEYLMLVLSYNKDRNTISLNPCGWYDAKFLLDNAKMADGSPCGVLEE